jgi:hypothetical protein
MGFVVVEQAKVAGVSHDVQVDHILTDYHRHIIMCIREENIGGSRRIGEYACTALGLTPEQLNSFVPVRNVTLPSGAVVPMRSAPPASSSRAGSQAPPSLVHAAVPLVNAQ